MDYTGNTNKSKAIPAEETVPQEPRVVNKITTGTVVVKKPGIGSKFKAVFFGGELKGAAQYIVADVLLPAFRNLLVDATTKGVERVVYGESSIRPGRRPEFRSRIQYHSPFSRSSVMDPRSATRLPGASPTLSTRKETDHLILASRQEAEDVLQGMLDIIDKYEDASLADLYSLVGLPVSPINHKWGWTNLVHTEIRQTREGFLLDLPPAEEIRGV